MKTMKILNADTVTSHKTDEFSNDTINCDKVNNSNENEVHMFIMLNMMKFVNIIMKMIVWIHR